MKICSGRKPVTYTVLLHPVTRVSEPSALIFDSISREYDEHMVQSGFTNTMDHLLRRTLSELDAISSVVELGCGSGLSTEIIARLLPKAEISAVDVSPQDVGPCSSTS